MANISEQRLSNFLDKYPQFKGFFVGWTKEDGLGISRIDDRWYQSTGYFIDSDDLIPLIEEIMMPNV